VIHQLVLAAVAVVAAVGVAGWLGYKAVMRRNTSEDHSRHDRDTVP